MLIRPLSDALQYQAETELNEMPSRVQQYLKYMQDWLMKQPHLKARTDDQWLLSFLRGCKFNLQKTKEKLDFFYTMKHLMPEFFVGRDPLLPEIQEALKQNVTIILPTTAQPDGPKIALIRLKNFNSDKLSLANLVKVTLMVMDFLINQDDNFIISGLNILVDFEDFPCRYIAEMTPSFINKALVCFLSAYPIQVKEVYFINAPENFESSWNLIKCFLDEKYANKLKICTDLSALYQNIPEPMLPEEYGGEANSVDKLGADLKLKIESYRDWFLEDAEYYSDETKRTGEPKTLANMFEVKKESARQSNGN